ncbi:MAG: hypothetical protein Q8L37_00200 [Candidatus Gottesmanbacteria bacterium]|nr:hypothetical protein [Candidatus Gottesmanbacteria bacterium]
MLKISDILPNYERIEYGPIALLGLETVARNKFGRREFLGVACHKGERRAPTAVRLLIAAGHPVANKPEVIPTLNYDDLINVKFTVSEEGLIVPEKMDAPCRNILVFHDGSDEEEKALKDIKHWLDVEADGIVDTLVFAFMRDEEGLLSIG